MVIELKGKVAVVSGSSRGIGRACAVEMGRAGAAVVVNYRSHAADAESAAEEIRKAGGEAVVVQADVCDRAGCEALVDAAVASFGRLDIAVANAVQSIRKPALELTTDDVAKTWAASLWHSFHLAQRSAQVMQQQGDGGRLIFISSVHAYQAFPTSMAYNTAKAGINMMAQTLATELAEDGILSNIIEPGWIDTPGERTFYTEAELRAEGNKLPLGRLGRSEEIAYLAVFLASRYADYITGSVMRVDGGFVLPRKA